MSDLRFRKRNGQRRSSMAFALHPAVLESGTIRGTFGTAQPNSIDSDERPRNVYANTTSRRSGK
jgi:hypothetical protein